MPLCLTLSIIRYRSRVKWRNPGKGVAPSPTLWCSSYQKWAFGLPLTMVANVTFFYININFLFVFVLECLICSMRAYYFLSKMFSIEKSIQICEALNFIEQKLSGPFWSMSGFTTGLLLLVCSWSGRRRKLFPIVLNWFLDSAERLFLVWWNIIVFGVSWMAIFIWWNIIIVFTMEPLQPKTADSECVLQAIKSNLVSSTKRISGRTTSSSSGSSPS